MVIAQSLVDLPYYLASNFEEKVLYLKKAADNTGDPTPLRLAGLEYTHKRKYDEAFELYKKAGDEGYPIAYIQAGQLAKKKKPDSDADIEWYEKAQKAGVLVCIDGNNEQFQASALNELLLIKRFVQNKM
jgi:TPR repeat protein